MKKVHPYLNFNGNTEEAFNFYKSVFGGEFTDIYRFENTPGSEQLSEENKKKIMHISLALADGTLLMGTDTIDAMGHNTNPGTNMSIMLDTESEEETNKLYEKLTNGGKAGMEPNKTFWGAYFASCTDKFGIQWMLNYTYPHN